MIGSLFVEIVYVAFLFNKVTDLSGKCKAFFAKIGVSAQYFSGNWQLRKD